MKVLMITGDKNFGPGNARYELQRSAVDQLAVVYWGRGSLWPNIPHTMFDVVSAQDPFWRGLFALRVARALRIRCNVQVHADVSGQSFIKRLIARFVLRRADSIRVVSEKIKKQVEHIGMHAKISVLPIFIEIEPFRALERLPHEGKIILWVGRFEPEKDPLSAADIFRHIATKVPDARFIFLGVGSLAGAVRQKMQGLSAEFPGWKDPKPYLQTADVMLSTSRFESWGASIIEALAAGVPVVAPDVGVAKEAGATVVPREQFGSAILQALQSPQPAELKIPLLNKKEWASAWKETL